MGRRLTITFCTRPIGGSRWCRHQVRRTLCRMVDPRQWHAEPPKQSGCNGGAEGPLLIVLRKVEQGERWPEVFDTSSAAIAAEREFIDVVDPADSNIASQVATDHTAAADTAAGTDVDIVEDSAELDIAAPAGVPVALGPAEAGGAKDVKAAAGPSVPLSASATSAAAQSAAVMGQAVLLRTRLMYQLF